MKKPSKKDSARKSPGAESDQPKRSNSIVDAAYSAAMFRDRGDQRRGEPAADAECEVG